VITNPQQIGKLDRVRGQFEVIVTGEDTRPGLRRYADAEVCSADYRPGAVTGGSDPLLLYFTSGTTALPKLVQHTHTSYPVGHLSTMYWLGLKPGDVHLNIASPGWAKHAWSNFFAPWNAEATVLVYNYERFDASRLMSVMDGCRVASFCAPPTVWRMLIQADLGQLNNPPSTAVSAGEPLNPEVIDRVEKAWQVVIRDGFGQTETTVQIANTPGQPVKPGSMGRPCPGFRIALVNVVSGQVAAEGEICIDLADRPVGLMTGYEDDPERNADVIRGGYYHTGDVGALDSDGYITYIGPTTCSSAPTTEYRRSRLKVSCCSMKPSPRRP
jgi:acetyl-CoA synthetase